MSLPELPSDGAYMLGGDAILFSQYSGFQSASSNGVALNICKFRPAVVLTARMSAVASLIRFVIGVAAVSQIFWP
jgi:hypothetical protein